VFRKEKIILTVLVVIAAILIFYNVFSVEVQKIAVRKQVIENARMEREMLEEIRSREAEGIAEFGYRYQPIEDEFIKEVNLLSEKMKEKLVSVNNLSEIAAGRLEAAEDFRQKLTRIGDVPGPLEAFYDYELEFIASDIETMSLVLLYYNSNSYSTFDDTEIEELHKNTNLLFLKAEEELRRVYKQYDLEYLLEEPS